MASSILNTPKESKRHHVGFLACRMYCGLPGSEKTNKTRITFGNKTCTYIQHHTAVTAQVGPLCFQSASKASLALCHAGSVGSGPTAVHHTCWAKPGRACPTSRNISTPGHLGFRASLAVIGTPSQVRVAELGVLQPQN